MASLSPGLGGEAEALSVILRKRSYHFRTGKQIVAMCNGDYVSGVIRRLPSEFLRGVLVLVLSPVHVDERAPAGCIFAADPSYYVEVGSGSRAKKRKKSAGKRAPDFRHDWRITFKMIDGKLFLFVGQAQDGELSVERGCDVSFALDGDSIRLGKADGTEEEGGPPEAKKQRKTKKASGVMIRICTPLQNDLSELVDIRLKAETRDLTDAERKEECKRICKALRGSNAKDKEGFGIHVIKLKASVGDTAAFSDIVRNRKDKKAAEIEGFKLGDCHMCTLGRKVLPIEVKNALTKVKASCLIRPAGQAILFTMPTKLEVDINGKIGRIDFREREALEEYEEATTRKKKKVVEKKINNLDTWLSFMENVRAMNLLHENGPGSFACKLEIKLDREINGVEESSETQEIDVFHHHDSCHCPCQSGKSFNAVNREMEHDIFEEMLEQTAQESVPQQLSPSQLAEETDTRDDDDSNVLAKDPMLSGHEATSPPTPVANAAPAPASADETSPFGDIDLSMDCPDLADIELIKLDGSRRGRNLRNRSKRPPRATDEEEVIPEDSIAVVSPSQGPTATAVPEPIVNSDDPLAYGSAEPQLEQLWSLFGKRSTLERARALVSDSRVHLLFAAFLCLLACFIPIIKTPASVCVLWASHLAAKSIKESDQQEHRFGRPWFVYLCAAATVCLLM